MNTFFESDIMVEQTQNVSIKRQRPFDSWRMSAAILFVSLISLVGVGRTQTYTPTSDPTFRAADALTSLQVAVSAEGAKLTVRAIGLRNDKGKCVFALFNNQKSWAESEKEGKAFREESATVSNGEATAVFEGLPVGTYAVSLHHDENTNGKFDTNALGMPKEGYGMSNNPKIGLSMPKFDSCKFDVAEGEKAIEIKAKY